MSPVIPRKTSERDVQRTILDWLKLHRVMHWRANSGAVKMGKRFIKWGALGCPDILCVLPPSGRLVGIEVKGPEGRQSEAQKGFQEAMEQAGGHYLLARSLEDVTEALGPQERTAMNGPEIIKGIARYRAPVDATIVDLCEAYAPLAKLVDAARLAYHEQGECRCGLCSALAECEAAAKGER